MAIGIGLMMLAPAELLLVSRFGWLMASLIGVALIGDVVFLPSLLTGPLGRLIERSTPRNERSGQASEPNAGSLEEETARTTSGPPRPHFDLSGSPVRQRPRALRLMVGDHCQVDVE